MSIIAHEALNRRKGRKDFKLFLLGQTISCLGSAFSFFAIPLLVFKITRSSLYLGLTVAMTFLPVVLFGLFIGVWVDRLNRKRIMIVADLMRTIIIMLLPLLITLHFFSVWWIYATTFLNSLLAMCFETGQFSAISSLVVADDLMKANSKIYANYTMANIAGSLLGGILIAWLPLPLLFYFDALSFLVSAGSLALIRTSFNAQTSNAVEHIPQSVWHELREGLRYVLNHPVLRNMALLFACVNFVGISINAQIVLFAKQHLQASDTQLGLLYTAGGVGVMLLSLSAAYLKQHWSYSYLVLGSLMLRGLLTILLALTPWYWLALPLWALILGFEALFNITCESMLIPIIPQNRMGRTISVLKVFAWLPIPLGSLIWGWLIGLTGQVTLVYGVIGALSMLIPFAFAFTSLRNANTTK